MKRLALLVVVAVLGSAGAASGTTTNGLHGLVMRGPTTPVCLAEQRCDEPAANVMLVFFRDGRQIAGVRTSATGHYRVVLRPGTYAVRLASGSKVGRRIEPATAHVYAGRNARLDFSIDTGIR